MNKILTKEEVDKIYSELTPEEIEKLIEFIKFTHDHWRVKARKPSKSDIVFWWRVKQRALADKGDSEK